MVIATDKASKFDQLHGIRYRLEHNQISRLTSEADKVQIFSVLNVHLNSEDWEVIQFAVQLGKNNLRKIVNCYPFALCSRNFQNVKLRLDFVENGSFYHYSDFT